MLSEANSVQAYFTFHFRFEEVRSHILLHLHVHHKKIQSEKPFSQSYEGHVVVEYVQRREIHGIDFAMCGRGEVRVIDPRRSTTFNVQHVVFQSMCVSDKYGNLEHVH